jgi:hypothetical protein
VKHQGDRAAHWAHIDRLFFLADPRSGTPEAERMAAVDALLNLLRTEVGEYKRGERSDIDRPLISGFTSVGLRIFAQLDPLAALAEFLGRKRKRGKRSKNTERDFAIAVEVAKRIYDGMSLDDAAVAVAERLKGTVDLSPERIENIYKANSKAARADEALRRLQASKTSNFEQPSEGRKQPSPPGPI